MHTIALDTQRAEIMVEQFSSNIVLYIEAT